MEGYGVGVRALTLNQVPEGSIPSPPTRPLKHTR